MFKGKRQQRTNRHCYSFNGVFLPMNTIVFIKHEFLEHVPLNLFNKASCKRVLYHMLLYLDRPCILTWCQEHNVKHHLVFFAISEYRNKNVTKVEMTDMEWLSIPNICSNVNYKYLISK